MAFLEWVKGPAARNRNDDQGSGWRRVGVYLYRADGRYPPATWAETPQQFAGMIPKIRKHIADRLEVRITNGDDHLLFHATNGGIKWDGIGLGRHLDNGRNAPSKSDGKQARKDGGSWDR